MNISASPTAAPNDLTALARMTSSQLGKVVTGLSGIVTLMKSDLPAARNVAAEATNLLGSATKAFMTLFTQTPGQARLLHGATEGAKQLEETLAGPNPNTFGVSIDAYKIAQTAAQADLVVRGTYHLD